MRACARERERVVNGERVLLSFEMMRVNTQKLVR